jgi:hypothetical protein
MVVRIDEIHFLGLEVVLHEVQELLVEEVLDD